MSKEKRMTETVSRDSSFQDDSEFTYGNVLALPKELKTYLNEKGLDWRFLNATQFRAGGNYHRSNWKPLNVKDHQGSLDSIVGTTVEGLIQRGDLILGVRSKAITAKHREFLAERNRRYNNFNKDEAAKLRADARRSGLDVKVHEGYDDEEKGFN